MVIGFFELLVESEPSLRIIKKHLFILLWEVIVLCRSAGLCPLEDTTTTFVNASNAHTKNQNQKQASSSHYELDQFLLY